MKLSKPIKLLILIIMCSTVYFIYNRNNRNDINYTVLGDGLSVGIDSYGQKTYSYGDYVAYYLKTKNKLKNYSTEYVSEEMTIEKLHNYILTNKKVKKGNIKYNIKDILRDTNYLTISIGINDLLQKLNMTSEFTTSNLNVITNEIASQFDNLIKEIRQIYKNDIYIIGYYDINIESDFYKQAIKELNKIFKKNKNIIYISTYIISENKNIFLPNPTNYYPNNKGYQLISSKIIDKISKKLEK